MAGINIQILSDLHLEAPKAYDVFEVPVNAPHLALLGDIGNTCHDGLFDFIKAQLPKFKTVFFMLGNHEPYHSSWTASKAKVKEFEEEMGKRRTAGEHIGSFVFLDQTRHDISDTVTILGCTLHSHVTAAQEERVSLGLNDFYHIEDWSTVKHNDAHDSDLAWLDSQVECISREEPDRKIIIFTHHCPTLDHRCVDPAHKGSHISSGFCTDLSQQKCWISSSVSVWAFGHTHFNCDYEDESSGKRVVTNQRGYYFQQAKAFEASKTLSL